VTKILAKAYTSPTLVLLAMDWPDGESSPNFLGFAIRRTPGFQDNKTGTFSDHSWLPNRIGFNGPPPTGQPDPPSNQAPIQKFLWWDARLDGLKASSKLSYEITPIIGNPNNLNPIESDSMIIDVIIPDHIEFGIGTWFNRAVMSSQAFSRILDAMGIHKDLKPSQSDALKLRAWLANGMERPLPEFITLAHSCRRYLSSNR
jgi:hypothetical protein